MEIYKPAEDSELLAEQVKKIVEYAYTEEADIDIKRAIAEYWNALANIRVGRLEGVYNFPDLIDFFKTLQKLGD